MARLKRLQTSLKLAATVTVFASLFSAPQASASGALEGEIVPFSLGAPTTTYPNAFSGVGIGLQIDYFFDTTPWGITAGFLSQGDGKFESLRGRYYMIGHPQLAAPHPQSKIVIESRSRGFFIDAGFAPYQVSSTPNTSTTSSTTTTNTASVVNTTSGIGLVGGIGLEQPFFWGTFLGVRMDLLSTAGGSNPFSVILLEVSVGLPVAF